MVTGNILQKPVIVRFTIGAKDKKCQYMDYVLNRNKEKINFVAILKFDFIARPSLSQPTVHLNYCVAERFSREMFQTLPSLFCI